MDINKEIKKSSRGEILNWGKGVNKNEEGEVISYGFAESIDPNLFHPDPTASTSEQRKIHKACLKDWNVDFKAKSWENYSVGKEEPVENTLSELDINSPKTVSLTFLAILRSTPKAMLIQFADGSKYWFPRSRIFVEESKNILFAEDWLLKDKPGTTDFIRRDR